MIIRLNYNINVINPIIYIFLVIIKFDGAREERRDPDDEGEDGSIYPYTEARLQ